MIRHGANFGPSEVDGSSLLSELDTEGRSGSNPVLKRFFLKDGAYQWMYIVKTGAQWQIPGLPVSLYGEAGAVFSHYTNINVPANVTGMAHQYEKINTSDYPESTGIIITLGIKVFPR